MSRYALFLLALPASLLSQGFGPNVAISPYAALDQSLSTKPLLLGASLGVTMGPIALRASGGVAHASWQLSDTTTTFASNQPIRAFAGDVDLVLNPGRQAGAAGTFGSLEPRLFAGYGVRGEAIPNASTKTHKVVSVGTIMSYSVLSRLRFDVEARRLAPIDAVKGLFDGTRGAWEYRAGLALHFGNGAMRPTPGILRLPGMGGIGGSGGSDSRGRVVATPAAGTLLSTADKEVGVPYVWGGTTRSPGFDCSGFVQYVYNSHGVRLPRTSREMALVGESVGRNIDMLQPGDLMFFAQHGDGRISHVAIYAGKNMMVHSSSSGSGVGYDDLTTNRGNWYKKIYVGGQRVLGVPTQGVTLAGAPRGQPAGVQARSLGPNALGGRGPGISAFLRAAGMTELSDVAKRLYRPDEKPDGPDGAPKRKW